jgi:hypothetical protein
MFSPICFGLYSGRIQGAIITRILMNHNKDLIFTQTAEENNNIKYLDLTIYRTTQSPIGNT